MGRRRLQGQPAKVGGAGTGHTLPSSLTVPPNRGILAPRIPGQAMKSLTPISPLAALPGPRWKTAPHIFSSVVQAGICLATRDLVPAGQAPWGDHPPPRWPAVPCMFLTAGLGSGSVLEPQTPLPCNRVFMPFQQAGASLHRAQGSHGAWRWPSLLDVPHGDPSVDGSEVPEPAPASPFLLVCPLPPGSWPLKGGGHRYDKPWLQSQCPGQRKAPPTPPPLI